MGRRRAGGMVTATLVGTVAPLVVGFTGSRDGFTDQQVAEFHRLLDQTSIAAFHHGSCVGCDADAHNLLAARMGADWVNQHVHVHPGHLRHLTAMVVGGTRYPWRRTLARNEDIVQACDVLWAFPRAQSRGTWHTVQLAAKYGKPAIVVDEDGRISEQ